MSDDTRQVLKELRLLRSEVLQVLEEVRVALSDFRHWVERNAGVVQQVVGDPEPETTRRVRP